MSSKGPLMGGVTVRVLVAVTKGLAVKLGVAVLVGLAVAVTV